MGLSGVLGFLRWDLKHTRQAYEKYYAKELADAFLEEEPKRKQLIYCYGLYHEKRYAEAMEPLESLLRRSRSAEDVQSVLLVTALCLTDLGRLPQAEQAYLALLARAPEHSTANSNLGLMLMEQGRLRAAEGYLRRAVAAEQDNAHARLNLGSMYFRMGRYEEAIPLLKEAAALNDKLYNAATALARCYAALGNKAEREHWAAVAVQRGQDEKRLRRALEGTAAVLHSEDEMPDAVAEVYREWKKRTGKVSLVAGLSPNPTGRSYVGGPALGQPPMDAAGKPMRQLAAIYCEEFPGVGLPEVGLIRIFIAEDFRYGLDMDAPNAQRGFRVFYDREFSHLIPGIMPSGGSFPVRGQFFMNVHTRVCQPMPAADHRFTGVYESMLAETGLDDPEDDFFEQVNDFFHRIGGYPCFHRYDPRQDVRYGKYDALLFQLDSMEWGDRGVRIGNGGVMNFCVNSEKMAAGDFSDVLYWWDC